MTGGDLKAYAVLEHGENTGGIIFARSDIEARKRGSNDFADGEITSVRCNRAQWADEYAGTGKDVPYLVMIDHGWHFECHGCGCYIDSDLEGHNEEDRPIKLSPVEDERGFFCTEACCVRHLTEMAEKKICVQWTTDLMSTLLRKTVPGAIQTDHTVHVYAVKECGMWTAQECRMSFGFPGSRFGFANFKFDRENQKPHVTIPAGDLEAWEAWRANA